MCQFPARSLLLARRKVAELLPPLEAWRLIQLIDEKRWAHEETGCQCWYEEKKKLEEVKS